MTPERWLRTKEILEAAWERDAAERAAFLDQVCADDPEVRSEIEALLASDESTRYLSNAPAADLSALAVAIEDEGPDLIGTRVGRYAIQSLIGKGGMGAVYRAVREDDFHMEVAIKLLKRGTDTDAALGRFRAERQMLAGLQHPNIARLLDGGATGVGLPYFVMEYVDGTPLLEYAAPLPVRRRVELFRAVCQAVHYAHQNQIVHRDIKPANLLVTRDGIPKLLDFGIAKLLDPASDGPMTATGAHLMTPGYASPEQVRGEPVTPATDIYSLGVVLHQLLTGERQGPALKPGAMAKHPDPDLHNIVLMALREEPERRYASAEEFAGDLDRFLQNLPVHARKESLPYRGRKFLKRNRKIAAAVALTLFVALAMVAGVGRIIKVREESGVRSIAVLPLENLSGDREQEYFADGVTDALISELARVRALRVISRTSVISYKGPRRRLPEIARDLGVGTIAEGSVLRAGNRIRIAVRLVDAPKDRPIWSGSYEGELRDVLVLQERVAGAIAAEIHVTLASKGRLARSQRVDLGAYDAYLKGRHQYASEFTEQSLQKSLAWFQQALALDPGYAPAYAGIADCYYMAANRYYPTAEAMPKAKAAALKAIQIDDTLGEAHATLALVRSGYEYDRAEAEKGFKRALDLRPSDAKAHLWYGLHLTGMGRFDEALAEVEQAQKLDPASPALNTYVGAVLYFGHRYDQIIQRMRPITEMYPNLHEPHWWMAMAYEQKGEWAKAIAEVETSGELYRRQSGGVEATDGLGSTGHLYAVSGKTGEARKMLGRMEELSSKSYVSAYAFAVLYAGLNERDGVFRWLKKSGDDREEDLAFVNVDPRFDAFHADPRWAGILRTVGLAK